MKQINVPEGPYDAVIQGEHGDMIVHWTEVMLRFEKEAIFAFGERRGFALEEVVQPLVYAQVARSAWMLCSAAKRSGTFDPVEFGKRCEAIAREQIQVYRTMTETGGST